MTSSIPSPERTAARVRSWDEVVPNFTIEEIRILAVEGDVVAHTMAGIGYARQTGGLTRTDYGVLFRVREGRGDRCEFHEPHDTDRLVALAREMA